MDLAIRHHIIALNASSWLLNIMIYYDKDTNSTNISLSFTVSQGAKETWVLRLTLWSICGQTWQGNEIKPFEIIWFKPLHFSPAKKTGSHRREATCINVIWELELECWSTDQWNFIRAVLLKPGYLFESWGKFYKCTDAWVLIKSESLGLEPRNHILKNFLRGFCCATKAESHWFGGYDPWTINISITWKFIRNTHFQTPVSHFTNEETSRITLRELSQRLRETKCLSWCLAYYYPLAQESANFFCTGSNNILGFVGHLVSVSTAPLNSSWDSSHWNT